MCKNQIIYKIISDQMKSHNALFHQNDLPLVSKMYSIGSIWANINESCAIDEIHYSCVCSHFCNKFKWTMYALSDVTMQPIYISIDVQKQIHRRIHYIYVDTYDFAFWSENYDYLFFGFWNLCKHFSSTNQKCTCRMWHSYFMHSQPYFF